jgi:folate-dependent phosphoribosylglycinamide formyltransferase PurN
MRAVLLTRESPEQAALAHTLSAECELVGLVLSENRPRRPPARPLRLLVNRVMGRIVGRPFVSAWKWVQREYVRAGGQFPTVPTIRVRNVNDERTLEFLDDHNPDLVLVSSTNLVGTKIIGWAAARRGILNLHTGLSPYVRGGPNCTNWCLADELYHLIGNTVMWLDSGIDSGPIAASDRTPLDGRESLEELHWKVLEHGRALYARTVRELTANRAVPRIPQESIAPGRTYYAVEWGARPMRRAWRNFKRDYSPALFASEDHRKRCGTVRLVQV